MVGSYPARKKRGAGHPDDDTPRLIYADWLEDHGDPARAEFIRVQIEKARLTGYEPRCEELASREKELLEQNEARWRKELPAWVDARFERGFVTQVEALAGKFSRSGAALWRCGEPIRELRLHGLTTRNAAGLVASPHLSGLVKLDLDSNDLGPAGARALAQAPALANLRELVLSCNFLESPGAAELAASPYLRRLTRLVLEANEVGDEGARALADSPVLDSVTELDLTANPPHEPSSARSPRPARPDHRRPQPSPHGPDDPALMGTPAYMSPEQVSGDVEALGPSCDIYSLGVILYELLSGRLPFQGSMTSVLAQVLTREPPPLASLRPDVDPNLTAICARAMAKQVQDRYPSMAEFAAALTEHLRQGPGTTSRPAPATAAARTDRAGHRPAKSRRAANRRSHLPSGDATPAEQQRHSPPTGRPLRHYPPTWQRFYEAIAALARQPVEEPALMEG